MEKLDFLKKYINKIGESHKYAIGKIDTDGNKTIELFNGEISAHSEYENKNIVDGQLYRLSRATCGHDKLSGGDGSCEVGKPKQSCIGRCYSKNKCAVYYLTRINLDEQKYNLSYEEILELKNT